MKYYKLYKLDETIFLKKQNSFAFRYLFKLLIISISE